MKRYTIILLTLLLVFSFSLTMNAQEIRNPDTLTYVTYGNTPTLDPADAYNNASSQVIFQVYDNLIAYEGESVQEFMPWLSTKVPTVENGLKSEDGTSYTFPLEEGVEFYNGNELTPEDVKYSFMRTMIMDTDRGPAWMLYEPIMGTDIANLQTLTEKVVGVEDPSKLTEEQAEKVLAEIDKHFEVDGNKITIHLAKPFPPFLNIIARGNSWGAIIDKEWTIEQGGWDGTAAAMPDYYNKAREECALYEQSMGTGSYILVDWVKQDHLTFRRNNNYWQEPAAVQTAIIKYIDEYNTRRLMLKRGDADIITVDKQYLPQIEQMAGVTVERGIPSLSNMAGIMNWDIDTKGNEAVGSGELDGDGIPPEFFADKDVRKAFSYAFNYDALINQIMNGNALRGRGPVVEPLLGYDENSEVYHQDLEKAEEHFRKAFAGELWEKGFTMTIRYNSGNDTRKGAADILKTYIEQINPKFDIKVRAVQWSTILDNLFANKFTITFIGWIADYPDPHNWVVPFMSKNGTFGKFKGEAYQQWAEENVMSLIAEGINETEADKRTETYKELQQIAVEEATDIWMYQEIDHNVRRDWVEGWYPHATRPDVDFYYLSK